jgi:4-amino-4-deoxy-L-arabinose transferase
MWRKGFTHPLYRFTACWFIFFFMFFSASSGKLATYILPCFPPLIILLVDGLLTHLEQGKSLLFFGTTVITAVLMAAASLFLVTSQTFDSMDNLRVYWDEEVWKWRILAAGFGAFSILTLLASNKSDMYKQVKLYSMAPLLLLFAVHFAVPKTFRFISKECMDPAGMIKSHMARIEPNSVILSDDYLVHAVCWISKRTNVYLFERGGELSYGLSYNDSNRRCIQPRQLRSLIKRAKRTVTLITNVTDYERYGDQLPKPFYIENTNGIVFAQYRYEGKNKK